MDKKEKIKLLSDVQSALENEALKEGISSLPSGDFLWSHIQKSLNAVLEQLLENNSPDTVKAVSEIEEKALKLSTLFQEISSNPVIEVLQRINQNLSSPAPKQVQQPMGNGMKAPADPRQESPVISATQEELRKEWEEQQRQNAGQSRRRGSGAFGPY